MHTETDAYGIRDTLLVRDQVADFGLARTSTAQYIMTQTQGTLTHMPPEVLAEGKVTKSADVYAFGVILWEMFTGERPFAGMRQAQILEAVMSASSQLPLELPTRTPVGFQVGACPLYYNPNPQIPRLTPAWDTFGFVSNVVTKFCKADPG